ncbi:class I SAM-dependent methyltransferase [Methylobacterium sp. WL12]|uniref:class I SAM-dependent methyltransferase n=1 Tax=Methylobacterium sp. WL12 TaxID=2603890 RepID=UPI0011C76684|nr:class I SAM-dependent methyltransferase [Methylobacterium sp. WL12]
MMGLETFLKRFSKAARPIPDPISLKPETASIPAAPAPREPGPAAHEAVSGEPVAPGETTWRQVLDPDWEARRQVLDWKGLPQVHDYVARLMTGRSTAERGLWLDWTLDRHLAPLREQLGRDLSLASFGCGPGGIEEAILRQGHWPLSKITLYEYDAALLADARRKIEPFQLESEFLAFDFNHPPPIDRSFDVVFFCHSLHHCADLERFLPFLNRIVSPDGLILGLDYFGPPRLQMDRDTRRLADEIFGYLPTHLRRNLKAEQEDRIDARLTLPTIPAVASYDPSEAPRSADLRSMLFAAFDVVEVLPMGGTLLRNLLADRAGNFRNESDIAILDLMMMIERLAIETRLVASDDLYFVVKPTNRI